MNFESLVKVGVAALGLGVATYGCVKAFRLLKKEQAKTEQIIAEGKAAVAEMEKQTAEVEAQFAETEVEIAEINETLRKETEQREAEFQENMERMDREEQEEVDLFNAALADRGKIDQLIQHFERGYSNDRQRKGSRRPADFRRGKRSASGE